MTTTAQDIEPDFPAPPLSRLGFARLRMKLARRRCLMALPVCLGFALAIVWGAVEAGDPLVAFTAVSAILGLLLLLAGLWRVYLEEKWEYQVRIDERRQAWVKGRP